MEKKRKVTLRPKRFSSFLLALFLSVGMPLAADTLDEARSMEREGRQAEARDLYLKWLGSSASRSDERFGRILLHLIRMPGSAEEDISLIERHISSVPAGDDRNALLEYALILNELRGTESIRYRERLPDSGPSEKGFIDRLPPRDGEVLQDPCLRPGVFREEEFYRFLAYNSWEKEGLTLWLKKAHTLYPRLLDMPDWLFQIVRVLNLNGMEEDAEEFRVDLMTRFPDSLEADLLTGRVSLLPGPADLMDRSPEKGSPSTADAESNDSESLNNSSNREETPTVYIQVGAFSSFENARALDEQLRREGLKSLIREDRGVFKLIILSENEDLTGSVMRRLGLEGFRIPRIP